MKGTTVKRKSEALANLSTTRDGELNNESAKTELARANIEESLENANQDNVSPPVLSQPRKSKKRL